MPRSPALSVSTEPSIYSPQPVYHPNVRSPSLRSQTLSEYASGNPSLAPPTPSLARGTSNTTSGSDTTNPPITPTDEVPSEPATLGRNNTLYRYYGPESGYGRDFTPSKEKTVRATARHTAPPQEEATARIQAPQGRYDVPLGQRIIPSDSNGSNTLAVVAPLMQRYRSAKELIDQCEQRDSSVRISTPPATLARRNAQLPPVPIHVPINTPTRQDPPRAAASDCVPDGPSYFSSFARSRGKLRTSFTNLVQLLGDKGKSRDKDGLGVPPTGSTTKRHSISPSASRTFNAFKLKLGKRVSLGGSGTGPSGSESFERIEPEVRERDMATNLKGLFPQKTGLLLYQSPARQIQPTISVPWMPYTVSLYPASLVLQVPNPRLSMLSSSKFQIPLQRVYDVHSVESKDLPPGFVVRPSGFEFDEGDEGGDLYVFEVASFGGQVERFAAGDFWTRKAWVSALVDVMMQGERAKDNSRDSHHGTESRSATPSRSISRASAVGLPNPWDPSTLPANYVRQTQAATRSTPEDFSLPASPLSRLVRPGPSYSHSASLASPSPYENPTTPASTSSFGVRTMTASPSVSRLGERSLVRNQLAMIQRQATSSPSSGPFAGQERGRPGSVGPVNWEALAEIRGSRSTSRLGERLGSVRPDSGLSMRGTVSGLGQHRPGSVLNGQNSRYTDKAKGTEETEDPFFRPWRSRPVSGDTSTDESNENVTAILSRFAGHEPNGGPATMSSPPVRVLGNVAPSRAPHLEPKPMDPTSGLSDRITSLSVALRESDMAHSTKAAGLGQLVVSTQDHIVQAVEDNIRTSSQEHAVTTGHLERLHEAFHSFAHKVPDVETQLAQRTEVLAMKEVLERVDQGVANQALAPSRLDELKEAVDGIIGKLDDVSTRDSILDKIGALGTRPLDPALMEEMVQQIKVHISSLDIPTSAMDVPQIDTSEILAKLDAISATISENTLRLDLAEIQRVLEDIKEQTTVVTVPSLEAPSPDLSDVLMKLDGISTMCQLFMEAKGEVPEADAEKEGLKQEANEKLMHLLSALREDAEHRTAQTEQTSELVRYSNELNTWLEKFVTNASLQMDSVGAGLGALRRDLGLNPTPTAGEQAENESPTRGPLEQLHISLEEQTRTVAEVNHTLNLLVSSVNEVRTRNEEAKQQAATDAILKMIDVQRQEQERLLHKLSSDLSSDIRGERLRFVEAMSQATSMNIQVHVEEFKKQLTREVFALTDEVSRLRDERKTIQHQIAQLFLIKSEHEVENGISAAPPIPASNTRPG